MNRTFVGEASMSELISCPKCKSAKVLDHGRKYRVHPLGCLAILGFPLSALHQGQFPHRLECQACGKRFNRRTKFAILNWIGFWLIAGPALALLAGVVVALIWAMAANLTGRF